MNDDTNVDTKQNASCVKGGVACVLCGIDFPLLVPRGVDQALSCASYALYHAQMQYWLLYGAFGSCIDARVLASCCLPPALAAKLRGKMLQDGDVKENMQELPICDTCVKLHMLVPSSSFVCIAEPTLSSAIIEYNVTRDVICVPPAVRCSSRALFRMWWKKRDLKPFAGRHHVSSCSSNKQIV